MDLMFFTARFKERIGDNAGALGDYRSIQKYHKPVPLQVLEAHANLQHKIVCPKPPMILFILWKLLYLAFLFFQGNNAAASGVFQDAIDDETRNGSGLFSPALRLKFARFTLVVWHYFCVSDC